ncbi:MAG TPA: GreA/GreB family elongation factor [Burkholderiales bacterium]|nr:GreA/GreB family elongation factor [Burkholderiales bacterium]
MSLHDQIFLTDLDSLRLRSVARRLAARHGAERRNAEELFDLLESAQVVPANAIAPDVVTMNSRVSCDACASDAGGVLTLVYPGEADVDAGRISVLSPLGRALLGARAGSRVAFETPGDGVRSVQVRSIAYQPEACGHWSL